MFDIYKIKEINKVVLLVIVCSNNIQKKCTYDMKKN